MSHIRPHPIETLIWLYALVCSRWRPVAQVHEGRHRLCPEGQRSRSIARAVGIWRLRSTKVCTEPMSESESPYIRSTPSFSRYELLRVVKHDAFSRTPVPFFIFAAQTSNLTGPSGLALERSTELAPE